MAVLSAAAAGPELAFADAGGPAYPVHTLGALWDSERGGTAASRASRPMRPRLLLRHPRHWPEPWSRQRLARATDKGKTDTETFLSRPIHGYVSGAVRTHIGYVSGTYVAVRTHIPSASGMRQALLPLR